MTNVATRFQPDISGSAVPSGFVGQKITWSTPPSTQNTTTTEADWTNANIVLTAGTWLVQANVCLSHTAGTTNLDQGYTVVKLTDSSNNLIDNQVAICSSSYTAGTVSGLARNLLPLSTIITINASATYKLRIYHVNNQGTAVSARAENESVIRSTFYAIRIA